MTIETKYNIGDTVWLLIANRVNSGRIMKITVEKGGDYQDELYAVKFANDSVDSYSVRHLFPSKQALLESL